MILNKNEKTDDGRCIIDVTIEPDDFNKAVTQAYLKQKNKIVVPGFRKGKASEHIIERLYGDNFFFEDAVNDLLPGTFQEAVKEAGVKVIGTPKIDIPKVNREEGANIVFNCELRPEFTVKKYKGLKASKDEVKVTDEEVQNRIDAMADRASRLVSIEDRAAENGDIANINFEGFLDGKPFDGGKGENYDLTLGGGQFIPGFEEQIVGHKPGEEFEIQVKFPDDYGAKELAGKDTTFKIKLNELHKKELPVQDDEFAKDVSEFDTLKELKDDVKKKIEDERKESADIKFENELSDRLVEEMEGEVPESMIKDNMEELARNFEYRLQSQGIDIKTYMKYTGQNQEKFLENFRDEAKKTAAVRLALEAVVRAEKISITDEDVEKEYSKLAEQYNMKPEDVKKLLSTDSVKDDLACQKALDVIKENAEIVPAESKEDKEKEEKKPAKKTSSRTAKKPAQKKAAAKEEDKKDTTEEAKKEEVKE